MSSHSPLPAVPASLRLAREDDILLVGLARAEKRNALSDEMIAGLEQVFRAPPDGVKAAVIHGEGEHFSAGLDLSELTERTLPDMIAHSRGWHRAFQEIEFGRIPVVAALHGAVVGGGLELVAACHVRVAERSVLYALPEGQRGIYVGGGGSVRLPRLMGVARMMDMMLTGRTYSGEEGLAIGLTQYVVDDGGGLAKAKDLARRIAANAPMTNFAVMHALPRIAEADPAAGYLMEALTAASAESAPEAQQRLRDFLEKRAGKVTRTS
jgi:enoyl-CoA hydratase/carnithine racemase